MRAWHADQIISCIAIRSSGRPRLEPPECGLPLDGGNWKKNQRALGQICARELKNSLPLFVRTRLVPTLRPKLNKLSMHVLSRGNELKLLKLTINRKGNVACDTADLRRNLRDLNDMAIQPPLRMSGELEGSSNVQQAVLGVHSQDFVRLRVDKNIDRLATLSSQFLKESLFGLIMLGGQNLAAL